MENFENEEWRVIKGFSRYEVSSIGRVRSSVRWPNSPRILKCSKNKCGYISSRFMDDSGNNVPVLIHRLEMMEFDPISNPEEMEVDHINFIRDDNRLCNLRWLTRKENIRHSYSNGRRDEELKRLWDGVTGEKSVCSKLTELQAIEIRAARRIGESFAALAEKYNVAKTTIKAACYGLSWKKSLESSPAIQRNKNKTKNIFHRHKVADANKNRLFGEAHHNSKLTPEKVMEILELFEGGMRVRRIAIKYGVHKSTIKSIIDGKTWKKI